jgi:Domain of Unknown Function (DUF1080)
MKIIMPALVAVSFLMGACNSSAPPAEEKTEDTTAAAEAAIVMENNTLSAEEREQGWQLLFDGVSKNGWHVFNNKTDGAAWKVADGTLYLDTTVKKEGKIVGGGDLITDSTFENYHLVLEWKISQNGNSGMIFNVAEGKKYEHTYDTGPEMQVLDNAGHPDAKIPKHRAGDLYDLISCSTETVRPYGEWNKAEIRVLNGKLDFFLNGTNVVSTTLWDDNWKKMLAGSKFRNMADFGTIKNGHFALQDHDNLVWYRNIKIRKL